MKTFLMIAVISIASLNSNAQTFITKNGKITFFSKTSMENIEATNNQVVSALTKAGALQFSVTIVNFQFRKALMQEHFNEKYMESGTYPKSNFKGTITDISKVDFSKDGSYAVNVTGDLTIHGVTKKVSVPGTITIEGGKVNAKATFNVLLADYKIEVESSVMASISKSIEIRVDCNYLPK